MNEPGGKHDGRNPIFVTRRAPNRPPHGVPRSWPVRAPPPCRVGVAKQPSDSPVPEHRYSAVSMFDGSIEAHYNLDLERPRLAQESQLAQVLCRVCTTERCRFAHRRNSMCSWWRQPDIDCVRIIDRAAHRRGAGTRVACVLSLTVCDWSTVVSCHPEPRWDRHHTGIRIRFERHQWRRRFMLSTYGKRLRVDMRHRSNRCEAVSSSWSPRRIQCPTLDCEAAQSCTRAIWQCLL